ncbi:hypothetical protein NIES4106_49040 [Fischerella sp. NIES-4106]|nr:hypothetical protein NIES4106_49040 [Fischerella sp. NIES-4106]
MQLHLAFEALLRLNKGCQAWRMWEPDSPSYPTIIFTTTPHKNDQQQRKKRTC